MVLYLQCESEGTLSKQDKGRQHHRMKGGLIRHKAYDHQNHETPGERRTVQRKESRKAAKEPFWYYASRVDK